MQDPNPIPAEPAKDLAPSPDRDPVMVVIVAVVLVALVCTAYNSLLRQQLVMWDDQIYLMENRNLAGGITKWRNIQWAFADQYLANYHPVTWLSFLADISLYGMDPWPSNAKAWGFKLTNLVLHIANTVLVLWIFLRMTGRLWASAFVAALFALHPLHVESVAWATERKDVLSTFFCLLAIDSYLRYAKRGSIWFYLLMLVWFVVSLLSKQMYVTLFGVLLLLDYWPLKRVGWPRVEVADSDFPPVTWKRALVEKIPVFLLAAVMSVLIYRIQAINPIVLNVERDWPLKLENALHSYGVYLRQTIWPNDLAFFYPFPKSRYPASELAWPAALLAGGTLAAIVLRRRAPYVLCGWFWYLGTMLPVIGIVQVGWQAHADRYTYFPLIGIFAAIAFGLEALVGKLPRWETAIRWGQGLTVVVLTYMTLKQVPTWQDTDHLTLRALNVSQRDLAEWVGMSADEFSAAVKTHPRKENFVAWVQMGMLAANDSQWDAALSCLTKGRDLEPEYLTANKNLGTVQLVLNDVEGAEKSWRKACELAPHDDDMHFQLGVLLLGKGDVKGALDKLGRALEIKPDKPRARFSLGQAHVKSGNYDAARKEFEAVRRQLLDLAIQRVGPDEAERQLRSKGGRDSIQQLYQDAALARDLVDGIENGDPKAKETYAKRFDWPATYTGSVTALSRAHILFRKSKYLQQLGRLDDAQRVQERGMAEIERALSLWPYNLDALKSAALQLYEKGKKSSSPSRFEQARQRFEAVLEIDPEDVGSLHGLGVIEENDGHPAAAANWFRKALDIDETFQPAKAALAYLESRTTEDILDIQTWQAEPFLDDILSPTSGGGLQDLLGPGAPSALDQGGEGIFAPRQGE